MDTSDSYRLIAISVVMFVVTVLVLGALTWFWTALMDTFLGCTFSRGFVTNFNPHPFCPVLNVLSPILVVGIPLPVAGWLVYRRRAGSGLPVRSVAAVLLMAVAALGAASLYDPYAGSERKALNQKVEDICRTLADRVDQEYCNVRHATSLDCATSHTDVGSPDPGDKTGDAMECNWVERNDWTTVNTSQGRGEMHGEHAIAVVEGTAYACIDGGFLTQDELCPIE